jgi:hypothetical protein
MVTVTPSVLTFAAPIAETVCALLIPAWPAWSSWGRGPSPTTPGLWHPRTAADAPEQPEAGPSPVLLGHRDAASLGGMVATARVQYPARGASLSCPLSDVMAGSETRAPPARGFLRPQGGGLLWLA